MRRVSARRGGGFAAGFRCLRGLKQGELAGQFGGFGGEGVFGVESAQVCGFAAAAAVIFAGQFDMIGFAVDGGDEIGGALREVV